MAVNNTEKDIHDILANIERKYEIIHAKWEADNKQFEAKFRTQIPRGNDDFNSLCDEWVDLFSDVTDTVWAKKISNTGPKIRFRKQYQCWTHEGKVIQKQLLFDARKCRATLDLKVLTDNPQARRKNKHIRLGLNVVVKLNFYHLHPVDITRRFAFFVHKCEPQPDIPKPVIQTTTRLSELVAAMIQNGPKLSQKAAEKVEKTLMERLSQFPDTTNVTSQIAATSEVQEDVISSISQLEPSQEISGNDTAACGTVGNISLNVDTSVCDTVTGNSLYIDTISAVNDTNISTATSVCNTINSIDLYVDTNINTAAGTVSSVDKNITCSDLYLGTDDTHNGDQTQIISEQGLAVENISDIPLQITDNAKGEEHSSQLQQFIVTSPQFGVTEHFIISQPVVFDTSQVIPLDIQTVTSHFVPIITTVQNQNEQNGQII